MIDYRQASESDADEIWKVRTRAIRTLCAEYYTPQVIEAWSGIAQHPKFLGIIRNEAFFVATAESQIIGCGFLDSARGSVEAMFVSPDWGRRGVASEIFSRIEHRATELDLKSLVIDSTLNAVAFYEHHGSQQLGPGQWNHPAGFSIPCVHMEKRLTTLRA